MPVHIKGQAFIGFLAALKRLRGAEAHAEVVNSVPKELGSALKSGEILPIGWYPLAWYSGLHDTARWVCGDDVSRQVGREAARDDVNTIYRFILKFFSPESLLKQSGRVFGLFCEGGTCHVEVATKSTARIRYADCPGACRGMWESVLGGTEMLVEMCGGRNVSSKVLAGGDDRDATLLAEITWS